MAREKSPPKGKLTPQQAMEEVSFLRQKSNSLALRGHYTECAKLIEDNMILLYTYERWPENFFAVLKTFQRCYPALNNPLPVEDYLRQELTKKGIPFVFADMVKKGAPEIRWSRDTFQHLAMEEKGAKRFDHALAWCDLALKLEPGSSNLHLLRGWILEDLGRDDEALNMFEHSLELNATNVKAGEGIAAQYARKSPEKALAYIQDAIAKFPDEAGFYAAKADILQKAGKTEEALACLDKAAEIDPYSADYVYRKGELLFESGKEVAALPQFKRALALNEKHTPTLLRLTALYEKKQPAAALEYISTVVRLEPANLEAALKKASLQRKAGDLTGAAKQYREILERDDKNAEALGGLAHCCLVEQTPARAVDLFVRALEAAPNHPEYTMGLGKAYQALGEREKAIEQFKAALAANRKNDEAWARLGELYRPVDSKAALDSYEKASALVPGNPEYHKEKARVLLDMGSHDKAMAALDTATRLDPGNARLHADLGLLLSEAGNRASAVQNYREAISLDPRLSGAHASLAELLMDSDPDVALARINSAIGLDVANASFYCLKCRVVARIRNDARSLTAIGEHVEAFLEKRRESDDPESEIPEDIKEMQEMLRGDAYRVAMRYIERAIELVPSNNTYLCERAHLLFNMGLARKALEEYEKLVKTDDRNHEALFGIGMILARKKDKKALDYFNRAILLSPATARYHTHKAAFLARDPDTYEEALTAYDEAIKLDALAFEPPLEKARLLDARGDTWSAMDSYRRTLLINHNCLEAAQRMGELLADLNPAAAYTYMKQAAHLEPENPAHLLWLSRISLARGDAEAAESEWEQALALAGDTAETRAKMADLLCDRFPDQALPHALRAVELAPEKADSHSLSGLIYRSLGRTDEALESFEQALALDAGNLRAMEGRAVIWCDRRLPEALEAAQALADKLPQSIDAQLLNVRALLEVADPPQTDAAMEALAQALALAPERLDVRERYVELLKAKRALLRYPIEKAKLERMRRKQKEQEQKALASGEIDFEQMAADASEPASENEAEASDIPVTVEPAAEAPDVQTEPVGETAVSPSPPDKIAAAQNE